MSTTRKMKFSFIAVATLVLMVSLALENCGGGGGGGAAATTPGPSSRGTCRGQARAPWTQAPMQARASGAIRRETK